MDLKHYLEHGPELFLPNLSVDTVIIGYEEQELKCLLLRIGDKWQLPGGFVALNQSVKNAAKEILKARTGLADAYLKFLSVFGGENRKFDKEWKIFIEKNGGSWKEDYWINNRFVSLVYYSLVDIKSVSPSIGYFDEEFAWFSFDDLPEIWMDHKAIVTAARKRLKEDIRQEQMSYRLLPAYFTMPELHQLHQRILEEKLDRSRFQKKMLASGLFERLKEKQKDTVGRNPYQYTIKKMEQTDPGQK